MQVRGFGVGSREEAEVVGFFFFLLGVFSVVVMAEDWKFVRLGYSCPRELPFYGIIIVDLAKVVMEASFEVGVMVCWVLRWGTRVELVAFDTRIVRRSVSLGRMGWGSVLPLGVREIEHHDVVKLLENTMKH